MRRVKKNIQSIETGGTTCDLDVAVYLSLI